MPDTGAPPVIPVEFQQYNSYVVDPQWQRRFSIIWASVLGFFIFLALPRLIRSFRNGRAYSTLLGVSEDLTGKDYTAIRPLEGTARIKRDSSIFRNAGHTIGIFSSIFYWTLPGLGLNAGQIFILTAYIAAVVLCMVMDVPLMSNSNRAGFIALAQFPIVFLFATKNSIVSLLLGPGNGYEKLNFIHRWSGRTMFLGGLLHGALWIRNHLEYGIPIIGQQKETSGVAALGLLCVIVLTSLRLVRKAFYEVFYILHMVSFIAFFVTICYHTIYASPWIFPPLAFYGLDILMRMFRHRIKDATLVPLGSQMTLIHVPHPTSGWIAGQHLRLRVSFSGRIFESHPLTIFSAPPDISCITSMPRGISLGARVCGDWSRALNQYALERERMPDMDLPVQVMLDGPYGGCSIDLGRYESALLVAGGSGITFTLGLLDDIVGRCVRRGRENGEVTRRIEFVWCIRSFGDIEWFAPALIDVANTAALSSTSSNALDLHISIYVTCLCNPKSIPPIPNCDVTVLRPSVYRILASLISPYRKTVEGGNADHRVSSAPSEKASSSESDETGESDMYRGIEASYDSKFGWFANGGGVAVCVSGPQSLTREASNAVARVEMSGRGRQLGGVGLHTEVFTL
ncbi:hypothetical protein GALMADRAFT_265940 [Galerina marginata CBS 339.88]|uniref:FAD-binding FR-type domain-containing protein n=1 Tax=Galerina marginata (strain CBS 339.88) TaxID=685588 RepID=A0A067TKR3_GALM3|nr:hypothetical protein GALMADRAFT_265940 [Galerina marginata CBS 339.88]